MPPARDFEPPEPDSVRRVVVLQLYFLGDTLLATPALRALKRRFASAELEVVVKRRSAAALARNPHVDRLTAYDPRHFWQRPGHWAALGRRWRAEGVDLAVDLTADGRSARLLAGMRPAYSVGFLAGGREAAVQAGIPKACGEEHVARHMLRLVGLTGAQGEPDLEFSVSEAAREAASAWRASGPAGAPVVALHPGGNRELRRWRPERFEELTGRLCAGGARVWVTGGRGEAALGARLARAGAEDLVGRLDLEQAAAHLWASDLVIANDSAPMHLAAAVGTPVLGLFGPSEPHTVAPCGPRHAHLFVRQPCCPCDQRRCVQPHDLCLDRIPVDEVVGRALKMVAGGRDRPAGDGVPPTGTGAGGGADTGPGARR